MSGYVKLFRGRLYIMNKEPGNELMSIPFVLRFVFKRTYGKVVREETIKLKDY